MESRNSFLQAHGDLEARRGALDCVLDQKLSDTHPKLSDPLYPHTEMSRAAADMTYREATSRHSDGRLPFYLPDGRQAVHYADPAVIMTVQEKHLLHVIDNWRRYRFSEYLAGLPVTEYHRKYPKATNLELGVQPKIDGYIWHRGHYVEINSRDAAIVLQPPTSPASKTVVLSAPFPEIYTVGSPRPEIVLAIAEEFGRLPPVGATENFFS